jgi:hypothetical protein
MSIVVICGDDRWLPLLVARAKGKPFAFLLGKGDPPRLAPDARAYVVALGRLRFRAPLTPRRMDHPGPGPHGVPAGGLRLGVYGWRLELEVSAAEGLTIERSFAWWPRWREVDWRGPPGPPRKGEAPTVPDDDEERPWSGWSVERMPAAIGEAAARIGGPPAVVAPAPVVVPVVAGKAGKKAAAPVARGLFDGLV